MSKILSNSSSHLCHAVKIVNSRGVPGTLGVIARTKNSGRPVLLSNWHVLFGEGGVGDDVICLWMKRVRRDAMG